MRFRRHQESAQGRTRGLLVLFAAAVALLVLAVNAALALAWHLSFPFAHGYPALFFETNTGLVLLAVLGGCWFEQWRLQEGGPHVARLAGGVPALGLHGQPSGPLEKRLLAVVQEMALASRMRPPAAWVLPRDDAINAFAAGWGEDDAVIGVTRGALERLTREELQGVVAHECSHLAHGDTRLNMRLIGMVWGLEMVFGFGRSLAERDEHGRLRPGALFGWALMSVGSLGWLAGRLLQAAVSRQREFLADASAVQYTRNPTGLGGALRKIAGPARQPVASLQAPHAAALTHLLLNAPGAARWATHPPIAERIRRLYGRPLPGLPAPPLAEPPEADEPPPVVPRRAAVHGLPAVRGPAAAPAGAGLAPLAAALGAGEAGRSASPAAARSLDATAKANGHRHDEREAVARLARRAGPGERRAALLALVVDRRPAARAQGREAAWQTAAAGLPGATAVWADVQALGPAARLEALVSLARRSASAPRAERLALRAAVQALADGPAETLRALAVRRWLDPRAAEWSPPHAYRRLEALAAPIARAGLALPRTWGANARDSADWSATVLALLGLPPTRPSPPDDRALRHALPRLGRLAPLERPRLARAWLDASRPRGMPLSEATAEALSLACLLLDTPAPPALLAAPPATREAPAAALQPRSL